MTKPIAIIVTLVTMIFTLMLAGCSAEMDHGDTADLATKITVGESVAGTVDYVGDVDYFRFTAQASQIYQIDVALGTLHDLFVELRNANNKQILPGGHRILQDTRIMWLADSEGDYFPVVRASPDSTPIDTGSYTLTVSLSSIVDDHADSTEDATTIQLDQASAGSLDYEGDADYFRFTAQADQTYQIEVERGAPNQSYVAPALVNLDGYLITDDAYYGSSGTLRIIWFADRSEDYFVLVSAAGRSLNTGAYTLTISLSDIDDDHGTSTEHATTIQLDESSAGNLDYEGDADYFRFTAEADQTYRIDMALGTLEASVVELRKTDDQWAIEHYNVYGDSRDSSILLYADRTRDYFVMVSAAAYSTGSGSYTLTISLTDFDDDHANHFVDATPIKIGQPSTGTVNYTGDADYFRFTAKARHIYDVQIALGTLDDSFITVEKPREDWIIERNDDNGDSRASFVRFHADDESDQDRIVVVSASPGSDTGTGTYTLTVLPAGRFVQID